MLFRTRRSWPVINPSASDAAPGSGIGGGLELRGVGRCDGAGVVPGMESGGRVELYVSVDDGISESVAIVVDLVLRTESVAVSFIGR
jgi:hypothetical protein